MNLETTEHPDRMSRARNASRIAVRHRAMRDYAAITPLVIEMRSEGATLEKIADDLNRAGHRTRENALFIRSTVRRILERAASLPAGQS